MTDQVEVETFTEVRLYGQPGGDYPPYDLTFREGDDRAEHLKRIWAKIQSGEHSWTAANLVTREVTITTTPWQDLRP